MLQRIKTAIVLVLIVTLCMFTTSSPIPMFLLMLLALVVGGMEWLQMMPAQEYPARFVLLVPIIGVVALTVVLFYPAACSILWFAALVFWCFAFKWVCQYPDQVTWYGPKLFWVGLLMITSTVTAIFALWHVSPWWLMYVFGLVWSADSGAYFAGRAFGQHKLAPLVSPAKSIEGLVGGLVLTTVIILVVGLQKLHFTGFKLVFFVFWSWLTVFASVLGDLFESMLKRNAKIKDSGTILPGHGGVLDRIDSLLAAAPIFALGFFLAKWVFFSRTGGF